MLGFSLNPIDWVKDAAADVVGGAFDFLANWVSDALSWLAGQLMDVILSAGSADISDRFSALGGPSGIVLWLGLVSVILGLIAQTTAVMWRSDAGMTQLTESLLDLPVTLLMMFSLPALGVTVLQVFDSAAAAIGQNAAATGFGEQLDLDAGMPGFMRVTVGICMILALLVLYIEQLIRGHLATVLIVLGPFSIAMRSWTPARVVFQATVKLFCALAVTPLVMMLCLSVALLRYSDTGALDISRGLGVLAGLILAVLSPIIANKLFPVGDGLSTAIAGGAIVAGAAVAMKAGGASAGAAGAAAGGAAGSRIGHLVAPSAGGSGSGSSSAGGGPSRSSGGGGTGGAQPLVTSRAAAATAAGSSTSTPPSIGTDPSGSDGAVAARVTTAAAPSDRPPSAADPETTAAARLVVGAETT
jgi:hypothetical protein